MIILVVFGHAWRGMDGRDLIPKELFEAIDGRIYAFHMPVFFALSAWFFVSVLDKSSVKVFTFRRLARLLWPMVLWTYIFLGTKVLAGSMANTPVGLSEVLILPVPGVLHFWFLWALLILSFIFFVLKPFIQNGIVPPLILILSGGFIATLQFIDLSDSILKWMGQAIAYAPFFFLGLVLSQYSQRIKITTAMRIVSVILFSVIILFWSVLKLSNLAVVYQMILTLCVLCALMDLKLGRVLCALGSASMAIYLLHTFFSAFLRELLLAISVNSIAIHIGLGTVIGLIGPLILLQIARRTNTTRGLGF